MDMPTFQFCILYILGLNFCKLNMKIINIVLSLDYSKMISIYKTITTKRLLQNDPHKTVCFSCESLLCNICDNDLGQHVGIGRST